MMKEGVWRQAWVMLKNAFGHYYGERWWLLGDEQFLELRVYGGHAEWRIIQFDGEEYEVSSEEAFETIDNFGLADMTDEEADDLRSQMHDRFDRVMDLLEA